jgi:hypothetical protein
MERGLPAHQVKGGEQRVDPEKVIAVQMTDEYVVDLAELYLVPAHLHLGSLPAVYQKQPLMHIKYMSGWISV